MTKRFPPTSLKIFNRIVIFLQRFGIVLGAMRLLTVHGRKSGIPRTTPVVPFTVTGRRYIVSAASTEWVKNVRTNNSGVLTRGRRSEQVRLVDLPEHERGPILREFPLRVPHGVDMMVQAGAVADDSQEAFEAAAPHCAVFRVEPL